MHLCTRKEEQACSGKESVTCDHINNCSYYGCIENLFCVINDSFNKALSSINSQSRVTSK